MVAITDTSCQKEGIYWQRSSIYGCLWQIAFMPPKMRIHCPERDVRGMAGCGEFYERLLNMQVLLLRNVYTY